MDIGVLLIRVVFGSVMAAHGAQKLFGWFRGYGLAGTGGFFESLGFRPGKLFAALAGAAEFGGGLLFALGFLTPVAAAIVVSVMVVATATVHWRNGLFAADNGIEVTLLFAVAFAGVALAGPGAFSLDALFGLTGLWTNGLTLLLLAGGVLGGFANLALRRVETRHAAAA